MENKKEIKLVNDLSIKKLLNKSKITQKSRLRCYLIIQATEELLGSFERQKALFLVFITKKNIYK
ncbi:hypothetical protein BpHYR1_010002 [Brachionus plicatilis]|uniref:Uncharacterized protein n=1 Tax=Brachionus plicatilis TaxID=10195 RepID=A0A3M7S5H8_BRAPC|nr:hypothetical protein BpHYR1_010002 [Brachionus plicatilis]